MATAEAVARYFVMLAGQDEEPALLTQMHLHKLMYYAQGWHLGIKGRPLFASRFQAWVHGPVEVAVYPMFADYKHSVIALHEARDEGLTEEERMFIEDVWVMYEEFSAVALRNQTHRESPWQDARRGLLEDQRSRATITDEELHRHFAARSHEWLGASDRARFRLAIEEVRKGQLHDFDDVYREAVAQRRAQ